MKIRILGNSLRLRLTQSEVRQLAEQGQVAASAQFGPTPAETLRYSLEATAGRQFSATYADGAIRVFLPAAAAAEWAATDQVSLEANQVLDAENSLRILVEKDFKCLTARPGEDESDHFPNPATHC